MCLESVDKQVEVAQATAEEVWGYKLFARRAAEPGELFGLIYGPKAGKWAGTEPYPRGEWIKAREGFLNVGNKTPSDVGYTAGFHIYPTRQHADRGRRFYGGFVVRVKARGVHTWGTQNGQKAFVAREMFVPPARKPKAAPKTKAMTKAKTKTTRKKK